MKVEIKKIGITSLLFSVFPVAVFVVMLLGACVEMFSPEASVNLTYMMQLIIRAIQETILFLVATVLFLWVYNLLCAIGIRGVRVDFEEK